MAFEAEVWFRGQVIWIGVNCYEIIFEVLIDFAISNQVERSQGGAHDTVRCCHVTLTLRSGRLWETAWGDDAGQVTPNPSSDFPAADCQLGYGQGYRM